MVRQQDVDFVAVTIGRAYRFADDVSRPGVVEVAMELAHDMKYKNNSLDMKPLYEAVGQSLEEGDT